ncbi:MAG: hypothetical protein EOP53_06350 [Sphingobacteriales bacterium]|nr:MAG: hypothetical protein EOP53_06350 [Sphingobacteriales bacterium]
MPKISTIIFAILLCICHAKAQSPYYAGGRSNALADAGLGLKDIWAVHNNPSQLAWLQNSGAGIWAERKFNIKELSSGAFTAAFPIQKGKGGTLGGGLYIFGGTPYFQQQKYTLAYGLKLGKFVSGGIGLHAINTRLSEPYGSNLTALGDISVVYKINPKTEISLLFWNIVPIKISAYQNERLPQIIRFGANHKLSKNVFIIGEAAHEIKKKTSIKLGLETGSGFIISLLLFSAYMQVRKNALANRQIRKFLFSK